MGLREHEFDVAPELLAALARGTPGPLLDHAMVHGTNVAEAAAALRERQANERVHGDVNSAEAAVEAALHGVEAAIGSVRDRGLFDGTSVSGGLPGGPGQDGRGTNGPGDLGPGRGAGRIGIGKHGFVRGSTVFDFLAGQATSGAGRVGKDVPTVNPMQAAIDALNLHNKIYQRAEVARRGDPESAELRRAEDRAFELEMVSKPHRSSRSGW